MQFDWITVSAQIVNFLVLVWLLKHFLYQPVIRAMDSREERITKRLAEAGEREEKADEEARRLKAEREELDGKRSELLEDARDAAEERKQELLDEARREVEKHRGQWLQQLEHEQQEFLRELQREAGAALLSALRAALRDLADAGLELHVVELFIRRLQDLDPQARRSFASGEEPLVVSTAFDLEDEQRARLVEALQDAISPEVEMEFRRAPGLICGIQVDTGGRRLGWNLKSYVDEVAARTERPATVTRQDPAGTDEIAS